ncbi:MAG TPA: hypothetical protein VI935_11780, partial [Thermodesulfobacteriota bacterium]|nr:hypothetical protein [Thermodesulfobacteriota bacterium]
TVNNRIQKFDALGHFPLTFGSFGLGDGQFNGPSGIEVDGTGNIFVADFGNNRIQKFDSSGNFLLSFGTLGSGDGQFNGPSGVEVDSTGNIYVADTFNNRIQVFGADSDFDGVPNSQDTDSDNDAIPNDTEDSGGGNALSTKHALDINGYGIAAAQQVSFLDTDEDGIPNRLDLDSDGDGKSDIIEAGGRDADGDGMLDNFTDSDGDGLHDSVDPDQGGKPLQLRDSDRDGVPNFLDPSDTSGSSGCSVASAGSTPSIPLYLLIPVFIAIKNAWQRCRSGSKRQYRN